MEILLVFVAGLGVGYFALYLPYRELQKRNDELQGSLYHRVGYLPVLEKQKTPQTAPERQEKPSEDEFLDLFQRQQKALED